MEHVNTALSCGIVAFAFVGIPVIAAFIIHTGAESERGTKVVFSVLGCILLAVVGIMLGYPFAGWLIPIAVFTLIAIVGAATIL